MEFLICYTIGSAIFIALYTEMFEKMAIQMIAIREKELIPDAMKLVFEQYKPLSIALFIFFPAMTICVEYYHQKMKRIKK